MVIHHIKDETQSSCGNNINDRAGLQPEQITSDWNKVTCKSCLRCTDNPEEGLRCPRCGGHVRKFIQNGARPLGENPKRKYKKYDCDKCNLFWEKGDLIHAVRESGGTS